jgi:lysozyme
MTTSRNGYDLIKESEGLRLKSYQDTGGIWTIGYGSTGGVQPNQNITEERANQLLAQDVSDCEFGLNNSGLVLNQNQYDACIDFIFNLGITKFKKSTLFKKITANPNDPAIATEFKKWVYGNVNGVMTQLPGLIARRQKEADLYFNQN